MIESALAAGVSAYYQDEWYVAVPLYSLVLLEGFTLIGNSARWSSDVVGGGLPGFTTAETLLLVFSSPWAHELFSPGCTGASRSNQTAGDFSDRDTRRSGLAQRRPSVLR